MGRVGSGVGLGKGEVNRAAWAEQFLAFVAIKGDVACFPHTGIGEAENICVEDRHPMKQGREFVQGETVDIVERDSDG